MKNVIILLLLIIGGCNLTTNHESMIVQAGEKVKAFMIHVSHYDPKWCQEGTKENELSFDLESSIQIIQEMKKSGYNMLIVDIADGVKYESHPELTRHYSVEMEDLVTLARAARKNGVEFVPKLNFAKSGRNLHDKWMSPHWNMENFRAVHDEYFEVAFDVIDELIEKCGPIKYFHIGMDEDHHRSLRQYVDDIVLFHDHLSEKNIRTIIWNDGLYQNRNVIAEVHADKCMAAAPKLPKDIVQLLWDYDISTKGTMKKLTDMGFEVWMAPGSNQVNIEGWAEIMRKEGGNGFLMTDWVKCSTDSRNRLIKKVQEKGPLLVF